MLFDDAIHPYLFFFEIPAITTLILVDPHEILYTRKEMSFPSEIVLHKNFILVHT